MAAGVRERLARIGCLLLMLAWTALAWGCAAGAEMAMGGGWAR